MIKAERERLANKGYFYLSDEIAILCNDRKRNSKFSIDVAYKRGLSRLIDDVEQSAHSKIIKEISVSENEKAKEFDKWEKASGDYRRIFFSRHTSRVNKLNNKIKLLKSLLR